MPTGYTCDVADGKITTFAEFALKCARNFGALIVMRDEPMDAGIPDEFHPSPYHLEEKTRLEAELKKLQAMTPEEIEAAAIAAFEGEISSAEGRERANKQQRARYEAMLLIARSWTPPTKEHSDLKRFMVEQLQESIKFDCDNFEPTRPERKAPDEWLGEQLQRIGRGIAYHSKQNAEEVERTQKRNKWVKELRESLLNL